MNIGRIESFEDDDPIEETAVAWLIERDEGLSPARQQEFERWRHAHPRHAAAVARLEETWGLLETLPAHSRPAQAAPAARSPAVLRHRLALGLPLAAAAAIALILGLTRFPPRSYDARHTAGPAAVHPVALPDGSLVTLNRGATLHVHYTARERRVILATGEAHFDVAREPARPFLVAAGAVGVRVVGTAFSVRLAEAAVEITVASGRVTLTPPSPASNAASDDAPRAEPVLTRGDRAIVAVAAPAAAPAITRLDSSQVREALEWTQEMLHFTGTPLSEVVAQFNRRNRLQLRLGDPALAPRLVGGSFASGNVEGLVRLLERDGVVAIERRDDREIVLRQPR